MKKDENWGLEENDGSKDVYTPWPEDWDYSLYIERLSVNYFSYIFLKIIFYIDMKLLLNLNLFIFLAQIYGKSHKKHKGFWKSLFFQKELC